MDTHILTQIGLSPGEIKIYLALLALGEAKKTQLAKESGVSSSKVYEVCSRLEKKGFVGFIEKNGIKHFIPMQPSCILEYFEKKKENFEDQKSEIEQFVQTISQTKTQSEQKAVLFEGTIAIKNFFLNMLSELKKDESYCIMGLNYGTNHPELRAFFENFHRQRAAKGIKVKMLVNESARDQLVSTIKKNATIKFLPDQLVSNMIILTYHDRSFIFFLSSSAIGIEIRSDEITNGFKSYFEVFWNMSAN